MQLAHRLRQHDIERALSISILPNSRPPSAAPRTIQTPTSNSPGEMRPRPFSSTIREYFDDVTTDANNVILSTERVFTREGTVEKESNLLQPSQLSVRVRGYSAGKSYTVLYVYEACFYSWALQMRGMSPPSYWPRRLVLNTRTRLFSWAGRC